MKIQKQKVDALPECIFLFSFSFYIICDVEKST